MECRLERQELVESQPQCVDVGAGIPLAAESLGRDISDSANDVAGVGQAFVLALGQAEVGDPDHSGRVQEQVRRLDVAVNDAAGVRVRQRLGDLAADLGHTAKEGGSPARCVGARNRCAARQDGRVARLRVDAARVRSRLGAARLASGEPRTIAHGVSSWP